MTLICSFVDVRDHDKLEGIASTIRGKVGSQGLNLLINNAGVSSKFARVGVVRHKELLDNLEINTVAPIMMTKVLQLSIIYSTK